MPSFKKAFCSVKSEHPNYGSRQGMNTRTWWANVCNSFHEYVVAFTQSAYNRKIEYYLNQVVERTFIDAGVSEQG